MRRLDGMRFAFVALLLASCAAPAPERRCWSWSTDGLDAEQAAVVEAAAARWSTVTREPVRIAPDGCAVHVLDELPPHVQGRFEPGGMTVRAPLALGIVMHEMGHGLGLEHTDAGGVMAPIPWGTMTDADVEECRRVGACAP